MRSHVPGCMVDCVRDGECLISVRVHVRACACMCLRVNVIIFFRVCVRAYDRSNAYVGLSACVRACVHICGSQLLGMQSKH